MSLPGRMVPWRTARRSRHPGALYGVGLLICIGLASCGGGSSTTAPQAPPPPAVTVSFEPGSLEITEGDTAEIRVRYQVRTLDAPWQLPVSPLAVTASDDDFELTAASVEIPAGQGVSGEASLELVAAEDGQFDEGDETVAIRFVPGGGVNARLGGDLQVSIRDAGVAPCAGLNVVATRPEPGGPADVFLQRSFTFEVTEPQESLAMEFAGPYAEPPASLEFLELNTNFAVNIESWSLAADGPVLRHTVDIQMRREAFQDPDLALVFHGEGCDEVGVACSSQDCQANTVN